jgi:hypothetical protein
MQTDAFWTKVRWRRNVFYAWYPAWIVIGVTFMFGYRAVIGGEPPFEAVVALFAAWMGGGWYLARRITSLTCPRCGKPALAGGYFFMRHAKCQHCGLSYAATVAQAGNA